MIGFVIVSHSARLAEGVRELAEQAARGVVPIAAAGGTDDPANPIGTDAFKVLRAIESVYSEDGVLVLMDLGSAVLSAETALALLAEDRRSRVHLCPAPLVEGTVAAVSLAAAGASLAEILREASNALAAKAPQARMEPQPAEPSEESTVTIPNRLGLHARPAAELVRMAREYRAQVTLENLTREAGPADAGSITGVLGLGARQGHRLRIRARGSRARDALDGLAAFVASGCGEKEQSREDAPGAPPPAPPLPGLLNGIPASAGIAMGPLVRFHASAVEVARRAIQDPEAERQRVLAAIRGAQEETQALYEWSQAHAGAGEADIFAAQSLFLEDPSLTGAVSRTIMEGRVNAEFAWQAETRRLADRLGGLDDSYLKARAADVTDVAVRVLRRLTGQGGAVPVLGKPSIVAARDLTPSEVQQLDPAMCLGLCLETGSALAHSVILARAMGIPAVVGLGPGISALGDGTEVALDGERGTVWISPEPTQVRELKGHRERWLAGRRLAEAERHRPAATRDGRRIRVFANISGVAEAAEAVACGAEGVGVLRTEFLFMGRAEAPGEIEQLAAYHAIAGSLAGRPLTIRTLDIGGDKNLPYVEIGTEANPFLGWRGIRVTLKRRDLFRTQLRAILRAGAGQPFGLLLPMITSAEEVREAKLMLREVATELETEKLPFDRAMKVGVMIEAPAAAAVADQLAREADFMSIGTNDLIQYVMAADRTNACVAPLADPFQPAVLRTIRQAIDAARQAGIAVALCGELAADPLATPLLVGLGLEEFSVSPPLIPELKQAIARWSVPEAETIAREALSLDSCGAVRRMLSRLPEKQ
ncbi:MAG TPA: phosphoenolpyruvate--protein phosphotransferase [Bryobacteraceae bacterium]|nr:phosphoenolpyruvate--protein phosphotransferase [Bryobacteraceae bacterium]